MLTRRKRAALEQQSSNTGAEHKQKNHKSNLSPEPIRKEVQKRRKMEQKTNGTVETQTSKTKSDVKSQSSCLSQNATGSTKAVNLTKVANSTRAIQQLMSLKYANVVERMKLTFTAACTQSLVKCSTEHARNTAMTMSNNVLNSQTFLKNHKPLVFLNVILMDLLQNEFPGLYSLQSVFELILGINPSVSEEYDVDDVIDVAAFTIHNFMEKFPPCWSAANSEYRKFLKSHKKNIILDSNEILNDRTLFADIIDNLETVIQPTKPVKEDKFHDSFNDSLDLPNFRTFESQNKQKFSFDTLQRDDKIQRLFLTLTLFVQLFEIDLAMWSIRNLRKPSAKIFDSTKGPLIGSVLWAHDEPNEVNYCIKNILKLYVKYVCIAFPSEYTETIGRLVNLIFNVFELSEFGTIIEYPKSEDTKSRFCDAFTKIIFEIVGCNFGSWLTLIKSVEHPRLKMNLINGVLTKIEHKDIVLTPKNIYSSLLPMEEQFDDFFIDKDLHNNNNNSNSSKTKSSKLNSSNQLSEKFPFLQKMNRRSSSELSNDQHVELHLIALNAFISTFHMGEKYWNWRDYEQIEAEFEATTKQYRTERMEFDKTEPTPFDQKQMEKWQSKKSENLNDRIRKCGRENIVYSLDVMNKDSGIIEEIRCDSDLLRKYRNDLKYIDVIAAQLPKLRERFPSLFPKAKDTICK